MATARQLVGMMLTDEEFLRQVTDELGSTIGHKRAEALLAMPGVQDAIAAGREVGYSEGFRIGKGGEQWLTA